MLDPTRQRDPERTRAALVEAALATLKEDGFAGTTARAIAQRAGVNQALVFYHFGGVNRLLLAAVDASAAARLARYGAAIDAATGPQELARTARELYREDVEGGHVTVVTELIGASLTHPELRPELVERMRPWLDLTQRTLERLTAGMPAAALLPPRAGAFALVALYLGIHLLSRLDPQNATAEELFELLERVAALASAP